MAYSNSYEPHNVVVTKDYVKATAVCSCGLNDYIYHTKTFKNYCPKCNSSGSLKFNPKCVPEGEWTCTQCDTDYCAADGLEKMPGSPYSLVPYKAPEVSAQEVMSVKVKKVVGEYRDKSFI